MVSIGNIKTTLLDYHPNSKEEAQFLEAIVTQLESCPQILNREAGDAHIVVSAFITDLNFEYLALVKHKKLNRWLQIGGHLEDSDSTLLEAVEREVLEEIGLPANCYHTSGKIFDLDVHQIPGSPSRPAHLHYDLRFLLIAHGNPSIHLNEEEALDVGWFPLTYAAKMMDSCAARRVYQKLIW